MRLSTAPIPTLLSGLARLADAYANPGPCSGVCGNSHDPSVIRHSDGTYFRFSTGNRISIASAPSLSGPWVARGSAIRAGSSIPKNGRLDLWAPDVTEIGGIYYLLYSVSAFGSQDSAIGYATSLDLIKWTDHGSTGIASSPGSSFNAIDGSLVADGHSYYMVFGSFWSDLYTAPMSIGRGAVRAVGGNTQVAFQPTGTHAREGAFIFQHGGSFFLFFSEGRCCGLDRARPPLGGEYKIMVCKGARPSGVFVDKTGRDCKSGGGTVLLPSHGTVYAPGGQGVMRDPAQGPVLYYHYVDTTIGYADSLKKFGWNKLNFGADGWPWV